MKCFLFLLCLLLAITPRAWAHQLAPLGYYLASAENVYLVQVSAIDGNKVTFTVTEVLRGKPVPVLVLSSMPGETYIPKSEWLLVSCSFGISKDSVGWAMKGDYGWIPGSVVRSGGKIYVKDWTSNIPGGPPPSLAVLDTAPDGTKGLTLDHVKQLLKQNSTSQP